MSNTVTKEQQRAEAIKRLRILEGKGLMPQVRKDFERGIVNFSEAMTIVGSKPSGILFRLKDNPKFEKIVRDFEEETDSLAYHATHERFEFGEILDIFYVSTYAEEWSQDRDDLKQGYGFVAAVNLNADWLSDYGSIRFEARDGGLVRTA